MVVGGAGKWTLATLNAIAFFAGLVSAQVSVAGDDTPAGKLVWKRAEELTLEGRGWTEGLKSKYDRLPAKAESMVPADVYYVSHGASGICVRFMTDAKSISVHWTLTDKKLSLPQMPASSFSGTDFYRRENAIWRWAGGGRPTAFPENVAKFQGTGVFTEFLLYFPLYNGVLSLEVGVPEGCRLEAAPLRPETNRLPLVFYGTSITQGACVSRAGMTYAAILGRKFDMPIVNLGFGGCGRMELAMASLIAEIDARIYVLDCLWNMNGEQVKERVAPFIKTLRAKRPDTPIIMVEDANYQDICPTDKGKLLRKEIELLAKGGISGIHLVESKDVIGSDGEGTVDGCHPSDLGAMRYSQALAPVIEKALK